jgi:biopolymer transport protein TolR
MARLGGLSRQRRGRPLNAEVNIINLVDVMLVLLIIFMVTAPILQGGIQVNLPKVDTPPVTTTDPLMITVKKDGTLAIGDKVYTSETLWETALYVLAKKNPRSVIVEGDAGASYGTVLHVLDRVQKAGIDKAQLATQPANSQ